MNEFELCYNPTRNRRLDPLWTSGRPALLCADCRWHNAEYAAMTPEEHAEDLELMAAYAETGSE